MTDSEQADITWYKSTASGGGQGNCVEVAVVDDSILVRNSKVPFGSVLSFTRQDWAAFLEGVNNREFTLDQTSNYSL